MPPAASELRLPAVTRAQSAAPATNGILFLVRKSQSLLEMMVEVANTRAEMIQRLRSAEAGIGGLGVGRLALFESFVTGQGGAGSDADVLVEVDQQRKTYHALVALWDLLEPVLARPVDLVTTEGLSPHRGPHITAAAEDVLRAA